MVSIESCQTKVTVVLKRHWIHFVMGLIDEADLSIRGLRERERVGFGGVG